MFLGGRSATSIRSSTAPSATAAYAVSVRVRVRAPPNYHLDRRTAEFSERVPYGFFFIIFFFHSYLSFGFRVARDLTVVRFATETTTRPPRTRSRKRRTNPLQAYLQHR